MSAVVSLVLGFWLVVIAIAACSVSSLPAPGRLGDEGWRVPMVRWGAGPTTPEGGPKAP